MRLILKRVICVIILCVAYQRIACAQAYRQLTADDFEGAPRSHSGVIAYTNCTIDFRYQASRKNGYYQLNFNIRLMINRDRSWMDKERINSSAMLDEILKHEQGHYIIAYLEQQELLREDTGHMTNRVQQNSWDVYFRRKLEYMPRGAEG